MQHLNNENISNLFMRIKLALVLETVTCIDFHSLILWYAKNTIIYYQRHCIDSNCLHWSMPSASLKLKLDNKNNFFEKGRFKKEKHNSWSYVLLSQNKNLNFYSCFQKMELRN